jgi:hypothetical protein
MINPLKRVLNIRAAKTESPKTLVVILASRAINGGTSLKPQSK